MAKRIRVSTDDVTYYTLPGASGELRVEMANVDDTIFGQSYQSESPSIGMWNVSGAAYFKGVAGYAATVLTGGTPTTTSAAAATEIGSTNAFQLDNTARRLISLSNPVVVYDNAVDHTADVEFIDYLNGIIYFESGYVATGPVTVDYFYLPTSPIGKARSFSLTQTLAEVDTTNYAVAQANGGWRTYDAGLKTVALEIGNVWDAANDFIDTLAARAQLFVAISPNATQGSGTEEVMFRGMFKYLSQGQSGNVGALEEETLNLNLYVPSGELIRAPFAWYFGSTNDLSPAVQVCLEAWEDGTPIYVEYSPDGTVGKTGQAIVTEASLANSYEGQNEFSFNFMGTGTIADL
jgi:hypothetical protein